MATAPDSESLYPPLTAALIKRAWPAKDGAPAPAREARRSELADNLRLFGITWAGGFVFFLTFLG